MKARILLTASAMAIGLLAACSPKPADTNQTSAAGTAAPVAKGEACDRACMEDIVEKYLAAMKAHDPSQAPLAANARFTENGQEMKLPDGLWKITTAIEPYRLIAADPQNGQTGFFAVVRENDVPTIISARLKIVDKKITEIEQFVSREMPGGAVRNDPLQMKRREAFYETLAPSERRSRAEMIKIANSYFSGLENNQGTTNVPFAPTCRRIENGAPTSDVPLKPGEKRSTRNMTCAESFALGYFREDTDLRDRRFPVVDEERGLVYALVFFDHDAVLRSYKLTNGDTQTVTRTAPWTWEIAEVFKIKNGLIDQVEAAVLAAPYRMRPNWKGDELPGDGKTAP
jgi:hypothetical protein